MHCKFISDVYLPTMLDGVFRECITQRRMPAKWGGVEQCPACLKSVYPTDRVSRTTGQFQNYDDYDDDDKDDFENYDDEMKKTV